MARVQTGAIVTDLKGSVGGWSFQSAASGKIARLRSGTSKSSTDTQTRAHANHTEILQAWQDLTTPEQQSWNNFAAANPKTNKYGLVKKLTGLNWFSSVNYYTNLKVNVVIEGPQLTYPLLIKNAPPAPTLPVPPTDYTLLATAGDLRLKFTLPFSHLNDKLIVQISPPLSRASTQNRQELRPITVIEPAVTSEFSIKAPWQAIQKLPWPPTLGKSCFSLTAGLFTVNAVSGISSVMTRRTVGVDLI